MRRSCGVFLSKLKSVIHRGRIRRDLPSNMRIDGDYMRWMSLKQLLEKHYRRTGRHLRRCHPRDLLLQVKALCVYRRERPELRMEYLNWPVGITSDLATPRSSRLR